MKRTHLYLDDDIANVLAAVSRQKQTTVSSLVRECLREKYGPRTEVNKAGLARELAGIWKNRADLAATKQIVRELRTGSA